MNELIKAIGRGLPILLGVLLGFSLLAMIVVGIALLIVAYPWLGWTIAGSLLLLIFLFFSAMIGA